MRPCGISVDQALFFTLDIDSAHERRRPRDTLECAASPGEGILASGIILLSDAAHLSIRHVFAFMRGHDAEGPMLLLFVFADTGGRPRNGSFSSWHYAPSDFLSKMVQGFDGALKTADEVIDNAHYKKLDHAGRARDEPL